MFWLLCLLFFETIFFYSIVLFICLKYSDSFAERYIFQTFLIKNVKKICRSGLNVYIYLRKSDVRPSRPSGTYSLLKVRRKAKP